MHLGNTYGLLNLLEFKYNKFESHCQAEYEFRNSNVGGKGCSRIISEDIRESRIFRPIGRFKNGIIRSYTRHSAKSNGLLIYHVPNTSEHAWKFLTRHLMNAYTVPT